VTDRDLVPQSEDVERAAALDAARRLGLSNARARLVSWSSRSIWHLPESHAALAITRPGAKAAPDVNAETNAARAAASAGVATPRILAGPIPIPGSRYATAFEWVSGRRAVQDDWRAIVREASLLSDAVTVGVPTLSWPPAIESADILGDKLSNVLAEQSEFASAAVRRLTAAGDLVLAHGDLQPANVLIDAAGRAWLVDFEFARAAPREWDASKLVVLNRRFGDPADVGPLLAEWRRLDRTRLAVCADAQEVLIVQWLVRMAREGTVGAAEEAHRRAATLAGADLVWQHLS
jgi:hypothetical protein